jgi:outer membrane cobalamin receptor
MLKKVFMVLLTLLTSFLLAQEKASLYGTVINLESEEGLEAVNIFFKDSKIGTMSNKLGCYSILNIDPGTYELITSMMGYKHFTQSITLKPGERRNLDISMKQMILDYGKNVIVTASRTQKLIEEIPASVDLIDEDYLAMTNPQDVGEALRDIKGLMIKSYGGLGATQMISLRGSSSEQVLVLIDGQRINNAQNGYIDLSNIAPNNIEKIEIVKGASSALYGSDAVGGVINIITKSSNEKNNFQFSAKTLIASFHAYSFETSIDHANKDLSFNVNYKYLNSLGDFTYTDNYGAEKTRLNADIESHSFSTGLKYAFSKLSKHPEIMLKYTHHQAERGAPGTIEPYYYEARMWDRSDNIYLKVNSKFINQFNNLSFLSSYQTTSNRYLNEEMLSITDNSFGTRSFNSEIQGHSVLNESIVLTYGLGQNYNTMDNFQIDTSYQRLTLYTFLLNESKIVFDHATLKSLIITPSLRYDIHSDFSNVLSPKIGAVMNIGDVWKTGIKSNFGLSYRAPTFNDLYWPEDNYTVGNPNLLPESGMDWDLGCRLQYPILAGLYIESVYFNNHMTNLIIWESDAGKWMPKNVDEALIHGVENELKLNIIEGYLSTNINYTFLKAVNLSENPNEYGKQLVYRPMNTINASVNASYRTISFIYNFNITDYRYTNRTNTEWLSAYTVSDLIFVYRPHLRNIHLNVNFQIKNLFNAQYRIMKNLPMPGREFRLSFEIKLNKKTNRRRMS